MAEFSELIETMRRDGEAWTIQVGDHWLQGRTLYGGLASALCLQAAQNGFAGLPPLRSAQIAFIGPASGRLRLSPVELRRGKSTVYIGVDLHGEAGLATRATFCFGAPRTSAINQTPADSLSVPDPRDCPSFFDKAPPQLRYIQHIEGRHAGGAMPFSGADTAALLVWIRHRDPALQPSAVALLALADAPPPAVATMLTSPGIVSTMTWSIDFLTDKITTDDGWWLVRSEADGTADGYSYQTIRASNRAGQPVLVSRQSVALF